MRKERTQRAKSAPKPSSPLEASSMGGSAGQMSLQGLENIGMEEDVGEMQMITPGAGGGAGKNKSKNKNKKRKKRKNKK